MKKIFFFLLAVFMTIAVFPTGVCAEDTTYLDVINSLLDTYGRYEVDENFIARGVIYGKWIDFDKNGTDEMLIVCKEKTNNYSEAWANVFVYGTDNGNVVKLLDMPLRGSLGQTDIGYEMMIGEKDGQAYIMFDTLKQPVENGDSENIVIFTMANNAAVTHSFCGEVLPWWETYSFNYTKCTFDGNDISENDYKNMLAEYRSNARHQNLFPGSDFENFYFCSQEKIDAFIAQAESKTANNAPQAANEMVGTLSERYMTVGMDSEFHYLILTFDTPQTLCVKDIEGGTFIAENVDEVQVGAKNYVDSMDGAKVKIVSYDDMFEGHSYYHTRPVVILNATLQIMDITVELDGSEIAFDQKPVIVDDRTMVPMRAVFEAMGADVNWDGNTQTVTSTKGDTTISMTIGKNEMYKNGKAISLDVAPQIVGDRTLVPVRAIAEAFDISVDWDGDTKTVSLFTN